jgi:ATP-dependent DNA ligase
VGAVRLPQELAWREVQERGHEGYVAKDEASSYAGGRTLKWLKVKQADCRVEERRWRPSRPAP